MKVSVKITYFVHGTTTDNEQGIATGWNPGILSKIGKKQTLDLKQKIKKKKFDAIFCSDLKRAVDSAEILIKDKNKIIKDKRLRECNYGTLTGRKSEVVDALKIKHIKKSFPKGESYIDVESRIGDFLNYLLKNYKNRKIAVVSHQAPQLALDVIIKGKTWERAMKEDWRMKKPKQWKPGWEYEVNI